MYLQQPVEEPQKPISLGAESSPSSSTACLPATLTRSGGGSSSYVLLSSPQGLNKDHIHLGGKGAPVMSGLSGLDERKAARDQRALRRARLTLGGTARPPWAFRSQPMAGAHNLNAVL